MNKSYGALVFLLTAAVVLYNLKPEQSTRAVSVQYLNFLKEYGKPIPQETEFIYRSKLFAEYIIKMEKHNADEKQTWKIGINQFSDLTQEEFKAIYLG